ncbi:hypothetical protein GOV06_00145 [Candidatus Woesearchaeota archaeon]|nr:hypothetical protein [Candidatus Woesearchaeota archaeon]
MEQTANNYFEGTMQLRNPTKEVIKFAKQIIENEKSVFIAKEIKIKNGIDWYLSSQKFMQILGKKLQKRFGGELRITRKLFTVKRLTSKRVYRVTVLFKLPKFKVGEIVRVRGREIKVIRLENKVYGIDIEKNKKVSFDYSKVD